MLGNQSILLGNQSILPSHGGVQYHDLIPSAQDPTASVPAETHEPNTRLTEGIPATQASGSTTGQPPPPSSITSPQVEQPDVEPEVQSIPSSNPQLHSPRIIPDINAPVEVPVPETSDEENGLYLGELPCYHLQEDQVFRFEVNINQRDADHWKEETWPEEMTFLVSAANKQRSEVRISNLNPQDRKLFEAAKAKEIDSWLSTETVCRILRNKVPRENVMRCRWILTLEGGKWTKWICWWLQTAVAETSSPSTSLESKSTIGGAGLWRSTGRPNPEGLTDNDKAVPCVDTPARR